MSVSKRLRYEIFRRDNHQCRYCGAAAPDVKLTVDHVIPTVLGGTDDPSNLVTACEPCNSGKTSSSPDAPIVADVAADALRWATAIRTAAAAQQRADEYDDYYRAVFYDAWQSVIAVRHLPDDWAASVQQFQRAGISLAELQYAVEHAALPTYVQESARWKYMCGIIHRRAAQRIEMAIAILASEDVSDGS